MSRGVQTAGATRAPFFEPVSSSFDGPAEALKNAAESLTPFDVKKTSSA